MVVGEGRGILGGVSRPNRSLHGHFGFIVNIMISKHHHQVPLRLCRNAVFSIKPTFSLGYMTLDSFTDGKDIIIKTWGKEGSRPLSQCPLLRGKAL